MQLAKQPPTLKMLMQKFLVGLWVKKNYFFNFKFTEAKFLHNLFLAQYNLFRADAGNNR